MKICYLIQTHKNSSQIYRLVSTIKRLAPSAQIIINHDFSSSHLDESLFSHLSDIEVIPSSVKRERGDFSLVQSYLDIVQQMLDEGYDFDWLINLTGQDYPVQPLNQVEQCLSETKYDGFLEYFKVFSQESPWGIHEGGVRYLYHYKTLIKYLPTWQKRLLKPIKIINYVQPFLRVNVSYGLTLGLRATEPFNKEFVCYGGSYLSTLSRKCVEYICDFVTENPDILEYYQNVSNADESFVQTILLNNRKFNLCNDCKRYFDFSQTYDGHPRILSAQDLPAIAQSHAHFARKFDEAYDSQVLDLIDRQLLQHIPTATSVQVS